MKKIENISNEFNINYFIIEYNNNIINMKNICKNEVIKVQLQIKLNTFYE